MVPSILTGLFTLTQSEEYRRMFETFCCILRQIHLFQTYQSAKEQFDWTHICIYLCVCIMYVSERQEVSWLSNAICCQSSLGAVTKK